jgi:CRP/FNR family cyclic AMP-dependent transcriptional regulator
VFLRRFLSVIKLDQDQTFRTLAGIEFFKSFTDEEKKSFSEYSGQILTYKRKATIIKQGMNDNAVFFILKGLVDVNYEEQSTIVLADLGPGSILGEMSFICGLPRSANAVAREESMVLRLEGVVFKRMKPHIQNKFKDKVIDILLDRIDTISNRLLKYL